MNASNSQGRWEFDENGNVRYVAPEESGNASDGSYHYSYTGQGGGSSGGQRQRRNKKGDGGWHWLLIVLGFMVWWPLGLVLLFVELAGKWPGDNRVEQELHRAADAAKNAAGQFQQSVRQNRQSAQSAPSRQSRKTKRQKERRTDEGDPFGLGHVRAFRTAGGILAGLFGFAFVMEMIDELSYFVSWEYLFGETMPLLALCLIGLTLIGVGGSRKRKLKRFEKYMTMIGGKTVVPLASLSKAMGVSEKKVEKDLEEMLDRGFWETGYVDASRRALVLGELVEEAPEEPQAPPEPEGEDTATATLRHIRQVNDAIANPELSAKIDRIEELTAKIFRLLEERPEKAGELRSFMNYYLPQTLKILESYSRLEAQGIEGENIAEAKQKIETMMDKVVDGYETQLDKLFADDVLDISADLKVMESMLEKDGLTADSELKL